MTPDHIKVKLSALALVVLLVGAGAGAWVIHAGLSDLGIAAPTQLSPLWFTLGFALGFGAVVLVHELGHAVAYRVLGLPWRTLTIGWIPSVWTDGTPSNRGQALISAAGPLASGATGGVLLVVVGLDGSLLSLLALAALMDCLLGLFPRQRKPNCDGTKLFRCLWAMVRGRGVENFSG